MPSEPDDPSGDAAQPDPDQGHAREWPSTPYSDEARAPAPPIETACVIALIGDCTMSCEYFPPSNRPDNHLAVRLRRAYPGQAFIVRNLAASGESAADFLRSGRLERAFEGLPRLDIAFIRYGINDRKQSGIAGCIASLEGLCEAIRQRYRGAAIFIETGLWVDHPAHYLWDRNARLGPLYDAMRRFAQDASYPLVDIFRHMEAETRRGNWDLRVRGIPALEHMIVDDSFDEFYGDDPAFYTNIHPNSRCLALIAQWETEALKKRFPTTLPGNE